MKSLRDIFFYMICKSNYPFFCSYNTIFIHTDLFPSNVVVHIVTLYSSRLTSTFRCFDAGYLECSTLSFRVKWCSRCHINHALIPSAPSRPIFSSSILPATPLMETRGPQLLAFIIKADDGRRGKKSCLHFVPLVSRERSRSEVTLKYLMLQGKVPRPSLFSVRGVTFVDLSVTWSNLAYFRLASHKLTQSRTFLIFPDII